MKTDLNQTPHYIAHMKPGPLYQKTIKERETYFTTINTVVDVLEFFEVSVT